MKNASRFMKRTLSTIAVTIALVAIPMMQAAPLVGAQGTPFAGPGANPVISWMVANVSYQRIYSLLYDMQNFSTRYVPTPNLNASASYIYRDYSNSSQLMVQSQYFLYGGYMLRNVLAVLPTFNPANKTAYVIGGHYDSWSQNSDPMIYAPGVDDDASGTVAAMEVARVLAPYRFNATLIFSAWTAEEVGLIGSDVHAASLQAAGQAVGATIGLDMIGNYAGTMGLDLVHDGLSEWIADAMIQTNTDYGIGLQLTKTLNLAQNSDHASFWNHGYNAIMAAEADFSPNWHRNTDTIDNVNITLITKATQVAAATIAQLAGLIPPGVGAITFDRNAYKPGDFPLTTLYDSDLNTNPGIVESAPVTIYSDTEPAGEPVTLTETGVDTSIFTGTIELVAGLPVTGKLEVKDGDTIRAEYIDADPPATRTATARMDAIRPIISNVYAIPDIDTATIHWKTNEPADSTVIYGTTPALGSSKHVTAMGLDHSVLLTDLTPATTYYYDVQSTDEAGNTAVDDNFPLHYMFVTLSGFVVRTKYGYVGYVKSNDPAGNYFTGPEILSGLGYQGTYRGAAQLNTTATPIPPGATMVKASFEALAESWEYEASGTWNLRLLNSSIDAGWTTKGYTAINGAAVDATIQPTLTYPDLVPGKWNSFDFQPGQFDMLRARVNNGAISFRLDGPPSPPGVVLFKWYTGNDNSIIAPRLKVAYSMTGDMEGPQVTQLMAVPNPTMTATVTTVLVTISDAGTGGGNVAYAEYFWGADPGIGRATPLLPDDGGFDRPTEDSTIYIDLTSVPRGVYSLGFRGMDQSGNWGPVRILDLYVGVWDLYPPEIRALNFNPPTPESGTPEDIGVLVTDDIAVDGVWANIRDPSGSLIGNFSMQFDVPSGWYRYVRPYSALGSYDVTIWANDTSNKWSMAWGSFDVVDTTKPVIVQHSAVPSPQNYAMPLTFTAWVVDRFLASVKVAFWDPSGIPSGNFTAIRNGPFDDNYSYMLSFQTLGLWTYCFYAEDTTGNAALACGNFEIVDGFPPSFVSVTADPPIQGYGQQVTITAKVTDPYIDTVHVNVTGPGGAQIGNFSMTRTLPLEDNWTFARTYAALGPHDFTAWATDLSGNHASSSGNFLIVDRTSPVFDSHTAAPNPAEVHSQVKISARISDLQQVTVAVEIRDPIGGLVGNYSMNFNSASGAFEYDIQTGVLDMLGTYAYSLWAKDASNNGAGAAGNFVVRDTTRPVIQIISVRGQLSETYNETTVLVRVADNFDLIPGTVRIDWENAVGTSVGNWTMNALAGSEFSYTRQLTDVGPGRYTISARDRSYNYAVVRGDWYVYVGQAPVAVAGDDQNITTGTRVDFNGSVSHDDFGIVAYVWRIVGPGTNELVYGTLANFTFTTPGTYTVTLTVFDAADRMSSDSFTVNVKESEKPGQTSLDPIVILAVLLIATIVIALLLLFLAKRRKTKDEDEKPEEPALEEKDSEEPTEKED